MSLINSTDVEYHANRTHLSSSNLKQLLKDPQAFYQEWVCGNKPLQEENSRFADGKLTHSLILEPETMGKYAVFSGLRRAGAAWEAFKAENANKTIITVPQVQRTQALAQAFGARKEAVAILSGGLSEHTMLAEIKGVPIKTRADYINIDKGYIADIKTTSYPSDVDSFKEVIGQYNYDLSAALYCQAAAQVYKRPFDFYFIVLSKADITCDIYKASVETLNKGMASVLQATTLYKKCLASGVWQAEQPKEDFNTTTYEILEV